MGFNCLLPICLDDSTCLAGKDLVRYLVYIIDKYDFEELDIVLTTDLYKSTLRMQNLSEDEVEKQAELKEQQWHAQSFEWIKALNSHLKNDKRKINVISWNEFEKDPEFKDKYAEIEQLSNDSCKRDFTITNNNNQSKRKDFTYRGDFLDTVNKIVQAYVDKQLNLKKSKGHKDAVVDEKQKEIAKQHTEQYLKRETAIELLWTNPKFNYKYLFHHHSLNTFMATVYSQKIDLQVKEKSINSYEFINLPYKTAKKYFNKKCKDVQLPNVKTASDDMALLAFIRKYGSEIQKPSSLPCSAENSDDSNDEVSFLSSVNNNYYQTEINETSPTGSPHGGSPVEETLFKFVMQEVKNAEDTRQVEKLGTFMATALLTLRHKTSVIEEKKPTTMFFKNPNKPQVTDAYLEISSTESKSIIVGEYKNLNHIMTK